MSAGTVVETHIGYGMYVEQVWRGRRLGWFTRRTWWDEARAARELVAA